VMTDYGKFYFDKLGKEIGIAKRLISAYVFGKYKFEQCGT